MDSKDVLRNPAKWFWYTVEKVKDTNSYEFRLANKKCLVDAEVFQKILDICLRVQGVEFAKVLDDETTLTFLIDLGYKGPLYKHPSMYVDHMHQPWRTLAAVINKCLLDFAFQIDHRQLKNGRRENMPYPSRSVIKKKVKISVDDNIILEPDIALELGKYMCLTAAAEEEAARQVHATHARIVTEYVLEPARRRPSGIAFRDTSSVSKKMSLDPSQKLKGIQTLTPEEQLVVDKMKALKEGKKTSKRLPSTGGSSEGTGVSPRVPNESTVIHATSSKGTGNKPRVPDKDKVTSESKYDIILEWGSKQESEYYEEGNNDENIEWVDTNEEEEKNDDDDDKSIDLEKTNAKEIDDEFVHSKENVQDDDEETDDELVHADEQVNDDEDEEMKNVEDANTWNGDEEITDTTKVDYEKTEVVKDDIKKAELPPKSSSLSISLGFGNQFLNLSFDTSIIGTIKDTTDVKINALLVSILEKDVEELKEAKNTTTLCASLRSEIPSAVNAYLGSSLGDALQKVLQKHTEELIHKYLQQVAYKEMIEESVQANIINEVKNLLPKFLPKAVSDFATPVIQKHGKSPAKTSKSGKSVTIEEPVEESIFEIAFDDIEQTVDDVANDADQPPDESTQTKDKDPKKD
ncbi:hypothetical protein Tco_1476391 [Tanacetum coccineum]